MIDLSKVTNWTIPSGTVASVSDSAGVQLWAYNEISEFTDEEGNVFVKSRNSI